MAQAQKTNGKGIVRKTFDGLINAISGMGTLLDKNAHSRFQQTGNMDKHELEAMYREDWIAAKAIDVPSNDKVREWRKFEGLEEDQLGRVEKEETRLQYKAKMNEALKWGDLYGGALLILDVEGTGEPEEELKLDRVSVGAFKSMTVIDRNRIGSMNALVEDPFDPNFGLPSFYAIGGRNIHCSRVVRFEGIQLPRDIAMRVDYWGDPVLFRMKQSIINAQTVCNSVASMMHESNVDVLRVPGLMHMVGDCEGEEQLMKRLQAVNLSKSLYNMLLIDGDEEYEKKSNTITGLKSITYDYIAAAAGAADIPLTRLLGVSPAGLNSTGESDLRNYYDRIRAQQESDLRQKLSYIDSIMFRSLFEEVPEDVWFDFVALWQPTQKEQAETEFLYAQRDTLYKEIVPDSSILKRVQSDGVYEVSDAFIEELESLEKEEVGFEESETDPEEEEFEEVIEEGEES